MKKSTNPIRARASVRAIPRNMVVRIVPCISGWRAMAVMALPATMPMPMPGPIAPRPYPIRERGADEFLDVAFHPVSP